MGLDRKTDGDASESALLKFNEPVVEKMFQAEGGDYHQAQYVKAYREKYPKIGGVPFNSTNKWMCTLHKAEKADNFDAANLPEKIREDFVTSPNDFLVMVKGAPERIMSMAQWVQVDPAEQTADQKEKVEAVRKDDEDHPHDLVPWDEEEMDRVMKMQMNLASKGERVLGFGMCILKDGEETLRKNHCKITKGTWEIDADHMTSMPCEKFPDGGFLWAKAGTKWPPGPPEENPEWDLKNVKEDEQKTNWEVPKGYTGMIF